MGREDCFALFMYLLPIYTQQCNQQPSFTIHNCCHVCLEYQTGARPTCQLDGVTLQETLARGCEVEDLETYARPLTEVDHLVQSGAGEGGGWDAAMQARGF